MIRGTTPTHTFKIPLDTSDVKSVMVIYGQNNVEIFRKETDACTLEGNSISVTLTQEETFKFNHNQDVQIQVRVLTLTGNALASSIKVVTVGQCLNSEVLI